MFISMYVRKEALISLQIEGTQCTLDDVLEPEVETNANLDVSDFINYVKATQYALKRLESLPLCCRLINENTDYNSLIRVALIHYQFETIHPFLDGNGRIGRLLILLYLMDQGLLAKPVIYISYFLKKNQIEYYDRISEFRRSGNFEQWIRFFLEAVSKASSDSLQAIRQLSALHDTNIEKLPKTARSKDNLRAVFDYIEQYLGILRKDT